MKSQTRSRQTRSQAGDSCGRRSHRSAQRSVRSGQPHGEAAAEETVLNTAPTAFNHRVPPLSRARRGHVPCWQRWQWQTVTAWPVTAALG
jgi:hypothetical protein